MKSKDLAVIGAVALFSAVLSILMSGLVISSDERSQQVEVVDPIQAEFIRPPSEYFNADSVNPTQIIEIGPNTGNAPFGAQ